MSVLVSDITEHDADTSGCACNLVLTWDHVISKPHPVYFHGYLGAFNDKHMNNVCVAS